MSENRRTLTRQELAAALNAELELTARKVMTRERRNHTLTPTDLVNMAYLRLGGAWDSRAHFMGAAARTMQQILVDHARRKRLQAKTLEAMKSGWIRVQVGAYCIESQQDPSCIEAIAACIDEIERQSERRADVVRLKVFFGLSEGQIAENLAVCTKTVRNEWARARLAFGTLLGDGAAGAT